MKKSRLIITLPDALKRTINKASKRRGCSKAEIVRTALYDHLKEFIEVDNHDKEK